MAAARAEADRREGLARLAGQVDTMRTRVESIDETVARLTVGIEDAAAKAQQTQAEFETVQGRVGELDAGEVGLDEHHDRTVTALRLADERVAELQAGRARRRTPGGVVACPHRGAVRRPRPQGRRGVAAEEPRWRRTFRIDRQSGQGAPGLRGGDRRGAGFGRRRPRRRELRCGTVGRGRAEAVRRWPCGHRPGRLACAPRAQRRPAARRRAVGAGSRRHAPTAARRDHRDAVGRSGGPRPLRRTGHGRGPPATEGGHRRRRPGRRGMGQRRFRPQAQHAGDRVGGREGQERTGSGREADRRTVGRAGRCTGRAGQPAGRRRAGAGRAQRVRRGHLGGLRAARPTRPGRPRHRRRMAAAHPAAQRARDRSHSDRPGARRTRAAAAQRPAGADVRIRTRRSAGVDGSSRGRPGGRGRGSPDCAHGRRACQRRSRSSGFAAQGRCRRARRPAACSART